MAEQEPFIEDIYHALRVDISAAGGNKVVASKLWPALAAINPEDARDKLSRCVNPRSKEKLDQNEVLLVKKFARDRGSFATVFFECDQLELERPRVRDTHAEIVRIQERVIQLGGNLESVMADLQRVVAGID